MIDISGLNKADVLAALYNASKPLGMGFLQYDPKPMDRAEAERLIERGSYVDYVGGRVMKVNLGGDMLDPWLYDRDNGDGAAARAISRIKR